MKYNSICIVFGILIFTGCASKLTTDGSKTRQIDISFKNSCVYIGSDEISSYIKFGDEGNRLEVQHGIRNITAKNGANSYVINDFRSDGIGHYSASFEMYKCRIAKEEYKVPKKYEALEKLKELKEKGIINEKEYDIEKAKLLTYE